MKQILSITILLLFMSCLTGHSFSSTGYHSTFKETSSFSNYLIVKNNKNDIKLNITVELETGECFITVKNPNNEIEKIEISDTGKTEINKSFTSVDGKWTLSLDSNNAKGAFDLKWSNK